MPTFKRREEEIQKSGICFKSPKTKNFSFICVIQQLLCLYNFPVSILEAWLLPLYWAVNKHKVIISFEEYHDREILWSFRLCVRKDFSDKISNLRVKEQEEFGMTFYACSPSTQGNWGRSTVGRLWPKEWLKCLHKDKRNLEL